MTLGTYVRTYSMQAEKSLQPRIGNAIPGSTHPEISPAIMAMASAPRFAADGWVDNPLAAETGSVHPDSRNAAESAPRFAQLAPEG